MATDQGNMAKPPADGTEPIDEALRAAIRRLRAMMIGNMSGETLPAAAEAWREATEMVTQVMQEHGIAFDEPTTGELTPAVIERLLDEAELSPGEVTPGARAMLAILRWLSARAPEPATRLPIDSWIARGAALYDRKSIEAPPEPDRDRLPLTHQV